MRISPSSPEFVRDVALRMREKDLEEFLALTYEDTREGLADRLARVHGKHAIAIMLDDGTPVGCGAMVASRPNVVTGMFFATDDFPKIVLPLTKFITRRLYPAYIARGFHRIDCVSIEGYDETHRWIELLGLSREGVLRRAGKGGEDFIQFAWVAP
jgi:hypothetical protein